MPSARVACKNLRRRGKIFYESWWIQCVIILQLSSYQSFYAQKFLGYVLGCFLTSDWKSLLSWQTLVWSAPCCPWLDPLHLGDWREERRPPWSRLLPPTSCLVLGIWLGWASWQPGWWPWSWLQQAELLLVDSSSRPAVILGLESWWHKCFHV